MTVHDVMFTNVTLERDREAFVNIKLFPTILVGEEWNTIQGEFMRRCRDARPVVPFQIIRPDDTKVQPT